MSRAGAERARLAEEREPLPAAIVASEPAAREAEPTRLAPAMLRMQAAAGNGAVARLVAAASHHAGMASVGPPTIQRDDDGSGGDDSGGGGDGALQLQTSPGGSGSTTVGPPVNSTYDVSGSLLDAANTIASRLEAGKETATPSLDMVTDGDRIVKATVTIAQTVELPNWTDRSTGTPTQQAEWDRFSAAIATHEAGHVAKDVAAWKGAHAKIAGKSAADGKTTFDGIATAADQANTDYDNATKHGLTQGTGIDPNVYRIDCRRAPQARQVAEAR